MTADFNDFAHSKIPTILRVWKLFDQMERELALLEADIPANRFKDGPVDITTLSDDEHTRLYNGIARVAVSSGKYSINPKDRQWE